MFHIVGYFYTTWGLGIILGTKTVNVQPLGTVLSNTNGYVCVCLCVCVCVCGSGGMLV